MRMIASVPMNYMHRSMQAGDEFDAPIAVAKALEFHRHARMVTDTISAMSAEVEKAKRKRGRPKKVVE